MHIHIHLLTYVPYTIISIKYIYNIIYNIYFVDTQNISLYYHKI